MTGTEEGSTMKPLRAKLPTVIAGMVLGSVLLAAGAARAEVVNQLNITGGSVAFNFSNGNTTVPIFVESFTQAGTLLMGEYQPALGPNPIFPPGFQIGSGLQAHTFTVFTHPGPDAQNPLPPPSGATNGGAIEVNLNALFASISGPLINGGLNIGNQLPALATGTFNEQTGAFHIAWDHVYDLPGDFVAIGNFSLQGGTQANPIPLPAALWLFGTGVIALTTARWRRLK
jgi:hypothetical protein